MIVVILFIATTVLMLHKRLHVHGIVTSVNPTRTLSTLTVYTQAKTVAQVLSQTMILKATSY